MDTESPPENGIYIRRPSHVGDIDWSTLKGLLAK
jgi:hypothetical protein